MYTDTNTIEKGGKGMIGTIRCLRLRKRTTKTSIARIVRLGGNLHGYISLDRAVTQYSRHMYNLSG
jgi:hypothetical protein